MEEALLYYFQQKWLDGSITRSAISSALLIIWQQKMQISKDHKQFLEKRDLLLHRNVVRRGVRADQKLLMVNEGKEDGWRAVSQDQLYLRRY